MGKKLSNRWEKHKDFKKPFDYVLYSDSDDPQEVTLHRLDMDDILDLGVSNELDFMTKALMTASDSKTKPQEALNDALKKAQNLTEMKKMVNAVVLAGVDDPKIYDIPRDNAARQKGLLYIDEIPFEDRIELFSIIFDTEGLSTFREEQEPGVGNVADEPSVQLPADGPVDVRSDDTEGVLLQ